MLSLKFLTVEITNRCNARCIHCFAKSTADSSTHLGLPTIAVLCSQLPKLEMITISGGDPLLHPNFYEAAELFSKKARSVVALSSGLSVDEGAARRMVEAGVTSFRTNLHGACAKTHERITGVEGSFKKALASLDSCYNAGLETATMSVLSRYNKDEIDGISRLCDDHHVSSWQLSPVLPIGRADSGMCISPSEYAEIRNRAEKDSAPTAGRTTKRYCTAAFSELAVLPNGDVSPCESLRSIVAGSIHAGDIMDIFHNSPVLRDYRSRNDLDAKECQGCDKRDYCHGGCKARAKATHSPFDPYTCAAFCYSKK